MKNNKYLVGLVQMDSQDDKEKNIEDACAFIEEAAEKGVRLLSFPENFNFIGDQPDPGEKIPDGQSISQMAQKARKHKMWIHCGSIKEENPGAMPFNTSVLLNPQGEVQGKYRKIHLFDVTLPDGTQTGESERVAPGKEVVVAQTDLGCLGLSICYDIRFPEVYRLLRLKGAQILFTPANFTVPTGKDHWETILKTRAIENGCYVVASAQIGQKRRKMQAFGSSLVVDPWGTVLARAAERPCLSVAEIDLDYLRQVRGMLPFENRRTDVYEVTEK